MAKKTEKRTRPREFWVFAFLGAVATTFWLKLASEYSFGALDGYGALILLTSLVAIVALVVYLAMAAIAGTRSFFSYLVSGLVVACLLGVAVSFESDREEALAKRGEITSGIIGDCVEVSRGGLQKRCSAIFEAHGKTWTTRGKLGYHQKGDGVAVRFVTTEPRIAEVVD